MSVHTLTDPELLSYEEGRAMPQADRGPALQRAVERFDQADFAYRADDGRRAVRIHRAAPGTDNWLEIGPTGRVMAMRADELWISGYDPVVITPGGPTRPLTLEP